MTALTYVTYAVFLGLAAYAMYGFMRHAAKVEPLSE